MHAVVSDVMSAHPISVRKTTSFKEIAARLREVPSERAYIGSNTLNE